MQLRSNIRPGDIIFFSLPVPLTLFHKKLMYYQAFLSCLLCYCNSQDYQKSHVAICTAVQESDITIAHINREGQFANQIMPEDLNNRLQAVLRPKEPSFAELLVGIASRSRNTDVIFFSTRSCEAVVPCIPSHRETFLTPDGFSRESHCSRVIFEAINLAAKQYKGRKSYQIDASGDISVSRLWQRLVDSGNYKDLQPQKREAKSLESSAGAETSSMDSAPLLPSLMR